MADIKLPKLKKVNADAKPLSDLRGKSPTGKKKIILARLSIFTICKCE